jgi:hypothetical protein
MRKLFVLGIIPGVISGFQPNIVVLPNHVAAGRNSAHGCLAMHNNKEQDRRAWLTWVAVSSIMATTQLLFPTQPAQAGIDPSLLKSLPVQGDESGKLQRLQQVRDMNRPSSDSENIPFCRVGRGSQLSRI